MSASYPNVLPRQRIQAAAQEGETQAEPGSLPELSRRSSESGNAKVLRVDRAEKSEEEAAQRESSRDLQSVPPKSGK